MKQKFFLALLTFGLLFVIFSIKANSASAVTLGAEFQNQAGFIGLTVYYRFWNGGVPTAPTYATAYVEAGSVQSRFTTVGVANNPAVEWYTDCADPNTDLAQWANNFWGVSQKIHAENPCGEPVIISISCPTPGNTLAFSWQMTGRTAGLPYNVERYHFFRSQAPDSNPDDNYTNDPLVTSASSGTKSWGGLTAGATYYVRVSAAPPSVPPNDAPNDEGWSSPAYSNTACQSATAPPAPTNLQTFNVPSCSDTNYGGSSDNNGNSPNIKNTWTNGSGTTKTSYQLFRDGTYVYGTGDPPPLWTAAWHWNLSPNALYTWRVSAGNSVGWSTWVDGPSWNVPKCSPSPPTNLLATPAVSCTDTTYSATFSWTLPAGTTKVDFELINYTTGALITSSSWLSAVTSTSKSSLSPGVYYQFKVRAGNSSGFSNWVYSSLLSIPSCANPDLIISSLTTDKSAYIPGVDTTVTVTIQVKNQGGGVVPGLPNFFYTVYSAEPAKTASTLSVCAQETAKANFWWTQETPYAAGATTTYTHSFSVPATAGTYLIRAIADWGCWQDTESNEDNNVTDITYQVQSVPTNPANLSVSSSCDANNPQVTFSWTDSANETGYWLDVNNLAWTGPSTPFPWGYKTLGANTTSFVWKPSSPMTSGSVLSPAPSTTYYWRLKAFNDSGQSSHIYAPNTTTPPGTSFTTLDCRPNLRITLFDIPDGTAGSSVNASVTIINEGAVETPPNTATSDDSDGDGFSNSLENYMGTNPNSRCAATATANDETVDSLPPDFNDSQIVDGTDQTEIAGQFGLRTGDGGSSTRYDFNADGFIDGTDLIAAQTYQGQICTNPPLSFKVAININGSTMDCATPESATQVTTTLGPNATRTLTIPVTLPTTPGTNITAVAMVDSDCQIDETNEDDNTGTDTYNANGFDLSASFVGGTMKDSTGAVIQSFQPGEQVTVELRITNTSNASSSSPATVVGVWPNQVDETNLPNCPTSAVPPTGVSFSTGSSDGRSGNVSSLTPNTSLAPNITVTFTASNSPGDYRIHAYVIPSCTTTAGADTNWQNNSTAYIQNTYITYRVTADTWFETTGGDVGSGGTISVSLSPLPANRYQSDYLLIGNQLTSSVRSKKWSITGYDKRLTKGLPYAYMAERFKAKASVANPGKCSIGSLAAGLNYCTALSGPVSGSPPSGNIVWFIDGDMTISGPITLNSLTDTVIFIVSGNITVNTSVTRIDGVYIAGGTFATTDTAGGVSGSQLVINGAVYGANVNLSRKLGGPSCGAFCNNATDPAEKIVYDPKYLIGPNAIGLLGSPGVSWKEVAP